MELGRRLFIHVQGWGDHQTVPVRRMNGRYKVYVCYLDENGDEIETRSVNSFNDIAYARAEAKAMRYEGIFDQGTEVFPEDITKIEIRERQVTEKK